MKPGYYVQFDLVAKTPKKPFTQPMGPSFCGTNRKEMLSSIDWFERNVASEPGNYRKIKNMVVFKVTSVKV